MDKYQNKYRIPSSRKPNWDYSADGIYFLTIVTQHRECNLGKIVNTRGHANMQLSDFGNIVEQEWYKSFEIRDDLYLDEFIVMPNHLHAIVILDKTEIERLNVTPGLRGTDGLQIVETHGRASLQSNPASPLQPPIRLPQSISSFIAGFKSAVNSKIDDYIDQNNLNIPKYNRNNHFFQPNYHDHIIRNSAELERIKNYIVNNPLNWGDDKLYGQTN